jgi:hypothetical protein
MVPIKKQQQQQQGSRWSGHDSGRGASLVDNEDEESLTEANQWKSIGAKSRGAQVNLFYKKIPQFLSFFFV